MRDGYDMQTGLTNGVGEVNARREKIIRGSKPLRSQRAGYTVIIFVDLFYMHIRDNKYLLAKCHFVFRAAQISVYNNRLLRLPSCMTFVSFKHSSTRDRIP